MASLPGAWKNFDDIEDSLSLEELNLILETTRENKRRDQVFLAALQGVDLNKNENMEEKRKEIERRAAARLRGVSEDQATFEEFGISFEQE